jgi:eukaryotic-like serine/threonine-protein kinase
MAHARDEHTSQDGDSVFDDELLDDFAPTRVSIDPRNALAMMSERDFRPGQVRAGDLIAGKYRVARVHKRGALGVTVEALHTQLGQRVAVRILAADPAAYPEAARRFLRGARLAVQFQNEHTARIMDVGTLESGTPYIVAEFLPGSDLQRVLRVREWLPVPEAVDYVLQACQALSEAHAHDVVHRNLKPTNLFLTRRDGARRLVVLDFGVSDDPLSDAAINSGGIGGAAAALAYLAPEQIRDASAVDARADIWALGAVLHEMLTGCALYESHTAPGLLAMIAADPPVPVSNLRPEIPAELEAVVLRCLNKDRDERYESVGALASALRPFASTSGHEAAERLSRTTARRARSTLPPPLPGHATRAIVRVPPPPKPTPSTPPQPRMSHRLAELGLTAVGLAAAGALGVYVAIHAMEGTLAAAIAPRAVVADLSPALPAPQVASGVAAAASRGELASGAMPPPALLGSSQAVGAAPAPPTSAPVSSSVALAKTIALPLATRAAPLPAVVRRPAPKASTLDRAVVADAKRDSATSTQGAGLFDDSN